MIVSRIVLQMFLYTHTFHKFPFPSIVSIQYRACHYFPVAADTIPGPKQRDAVKTFPCAWQGLCQASMGSDHHIPDCDHLSGVHERLCQSQCQQDMRLELCVPQRRCTFSGKCNLLLVSLILIVCCCFFLVAMHSTLHNREKQVFRCINIFY